MARAYANPPYATADDLAQEPILPGARGRAVRRDPRRAILDLRDAVGPCRVRRVAAADRIFDACPNASLRSRRGRGAASRASRPPAPSRRRSTTSRSRYVSAASVDAGARGGRAVDGRRTGRPRDRRREPRRDARRRNGAGGGPQVGPRRGAGRGARRRRAPRRAPAATASTTGLSGPRATAPGSWASAAEKARRTCLRAFRTSPRHARRRAPRISELASLCNLLFPSVDVGLRLFTDSQDNHEPEASHEGGSANDGH